MDACWTEVDGERIAVGWGAKEEGLVELTIDIKGALFTRLAGTGKSRIIKSLVYQLQTYHPA